MEPNQLLVYPNYDGYVYYDIDENCGNIFLGRETANGLQAQDAINIAGYTYFHNSFLDFSTPLFSNRPEVVIHKVELTLTNVSFNVAAGIIIGAMRTRAQDFSTPTQDAALFNAMDLIRSTLALQYTFRAIDHTGAYTFDLGPSAVLDLNKQRSFFSLGILNDSGGNGGMCDFYDVENATVSNRPLLTVTYGSRRNYGG